MSLPRASTRRETSNGATRRWPPPGWPNTAPVSPRFEAPTGSAARPRPDTVSKARSRFGSNATTVADRRLPSSRSTEVVGSPATTWAFVTTSPSPTAKPVPSLVTRQATPSTLTTDVATRAVVALSRPVAAGGGIVSGGWSASNTDGNVSWPTSGRSAVSTSGGAGNRSANSRATAESATSVPGQLVDATSTGRIIHTVAETATNPATPPRT